MFYTNDRARVSQFGDKKQDVTDFRKNTRVPKIILDKNRVLWTFP
jgi:hypothetical protein